MVRNQPQVVEGLIVQHLPAACNPVRLVALPDFLSRWKSDDSLDIVLGLGEWHIYDAHGQGRIVRFTLDSALPLGLGGHDLSDLVGPTHVRREERWFTFRPYIRLHGFYPAFTFLMAGYTARSWWHPLL